eukprot:TRINITY_DN30505_c0_g1_i2.p1 TRINITY_DN30505_c0_g1~~TRINITY_DN30505_c0_g1_i2.p1  ORF type:complete len:238 (-),score=34.11 TRINITY_DN30505_c0_g1_i2:177-890(-)
MNSTLINQCEHGLINNSAQLQQIGSDATALSSADACCGCGGGSNGTASAAMTDAMVEFYQSTNQAGLPLDEFNTTTQHGWNESAHVCLWDGARCDENANLFSLLVWYTSSDQRTMTSGTVPASLGQLSDLRAILLGPSQLSGSLPDAFSTLSSLSSLGLVWDATGASGGPGFSGTLPTLPASLLAFATMENPISGTLPALDNLIGFTATFLNRSESISGTLPQSWGDSPYFLSLIHI